MASRSLTTVATLAACLAAVAASRPAGRGASSSDWPQWRGPGRDGISQEAGLLKQWPAAGPKLRWQVNDIGDGYSTPAVAGTRIYLMSNRGIENEFVQALSTQDGTPIWTTRVGNVGNPNQDPPFPKARSTPTVDGDLVYALGSDGDLACLDAATGTIRWQKSLRKEFGGQPHAWAYAESPLVDGDVLVVTPGGPDATIVALDKKTGAVVWKSAVPGGDPAGYASAIVVHGGGRKQYVQFLSKGIVGVDAKTGERGLPNGFGGAVLVGDTPYGVAMGEQLLLAAEFATGKVRWKAESVGRGSLAYADGHLYVHGFNGDVALVEATPTGYREKGRFTPPAQPRHKRLGEMAENAYAYPVIANGTLYIRDLGTLWAYEIKASR